MITLDLSREDGMTSLHLGPLAAMWWAREDGDARNTRGGWLTVAGYGVWIGTHSDQRGGSRPLFSERYSGVYGIPARLYIHWGQWCVRWLRRSG